MNEWTYQERYILTCPDADCPVGAIVHELPPAEHRPTCRAHNLRMVIEGHLVVEGERPAADDPTRWR